MTPKIAKEYGYPEISLFQLKFQEIIWDVLEWENGSVRKERFLGFFIQVDLDPQLRSIAAQLSRGAAGL